MIGISAAQEQRGLAARAAGLHDVHTRHGTQHVRQGALLAAFNLCRRSDMAESTFGRRAVNDGKLVARLREGKRITIDTLDRIQAYIAASTPDGLPPQLEYLGLVGAVSQAAQSPL